MLRVKYESLGINEKLNCIDGYINKICPYEDFEEYDLSDIEYNVREFLKETESYIIDECGDWYEIALKLL